jgi:hypothetical protein
LSYASGLSLPRIAQVYAFGEAVQADP